MEGYTLLEYIESNGTQYIDTGVGLGCELHLDVQFILLSKRNLMGFSTKACRYFGINTDGYYEIGTQTEATSSYSGLERRTIVVSFEELGISLTAEDETLSKTTTVAYEGTLLLLGGSSASGLTSYPCSARMYGGQVYVDGELVRDFVPVVSPDGVCGLYDQVDDVFYSSASGVPFSGKATEDVLPSGLTECEYLESNGLNYVDTGFKPNQDTKVVIDAQYTSKPTEYNSCLFGARTSSTSKSYYWMYTTLDTCRSGYNASFNYEWEIDPTERRIITKDKNTTIVDGITHSWDYAEFQCDYNMTLFALNQADTIQWYAPARIYSCQIYDNGTLVRDYVPCMNSQGVYGLYDKVNNVFYSSATEYGFTGKWKENKTLDVSLAEFRHRMLNSLPRTGLPKGYFRCEYIESDGTNFIDTGFVPNQDTRVYAECAFALSDSNQGLFGSRISSSSSAFQFVSVSNYYRTDYGGSIENFNVSDYGSDRFYIDKNKNVTDLNGVASITQTYSSFTCPGNMYIFATNNNGSVYGLATAKLYCMSIYDNGTKVRDYVPCVNPEGYFGLYDLVTNEFYGLVRQETGQSYTVNLNSQWRKGSVTNPNSSTYDGVYESYSNYNVDSGVAIMTITITGYTEFTCYIRSYAESVYDYAMIGALDSVLTVNSVYSDSSIKAYTRGNQQGGTDIGSYTKVSYTGIDGGTHTIYVVYRKDGSVNSNDDKGYLLIDKSTVQAGGTIQTIGRGKVILPESYTWCESIYGDGNAYIDTGFAPNNNTRVTCDFEFMATPASANACVFGSRKSSSSTMFEFFWHYSNAYFRSDYNATATQTWSVDAVGRYVVDKDKETTAFNGTSSSYTNASFTSSYNLYLFALNQVDTILWYAPARIYYCCIFDNGTFTRLFVPCRNSEGTFGLYDMIEGVFYSSFGSSEFTGEVEDDDTGSSDVELPDYSSYEGVYIEDVDGYLYTVDEWDGTKTPNGVAVLYDIFRLVIALENAAENVQWSTEYADCGLGQTSEYSTDGVASTNIIIETLGTSATAALACTNFTFPNGQTGYLGTYTEMLNVFGNNVDDIAAAFSKLEADSIDEQGDFWTSTDSEEAACVFERSGGISYIEWGDKVNYTAHVRAFTTLKSDGGGDTVNLITFTIDGTSYQAEEGMTWSEWCESDYNTRGDELFIDEMGYLCYYTGETSGSYSSIKNNESIDQFGIDVILAGESYFY